MSVELNKMGTSPINKLLLELSIPIIIGMFANALYNIVDRIFIGKFLDKEALAAATVYHPFAMMVIALGSMIGVGSTASVSNAFGAMDYSYARRIFTNAFALVLILLIPITVIGELFPENILRLSGASDAVMPMALSYFRITTVGAVFATMAFVMSCFIRSENNPKYALKITLIGAFLNIILDALFILVFNMGIFGAGLATAISQVVSSIYAIRYFYQKRSVLELKNIPFIPERDITKRILSIGVSSSIVIFSFGIFSLLMNKTLYRYGGDDAIATMGILMSLDSLLYLPIIGICDAAQPIFGYNYGAKLFKRIFETIKYGVIATFLYGILSFTVVFLFSRHLVSIFTTDEGIIMEGAKALKISYCATFFAGFGLLMASLFQALGLAKLCIFLGLCRTLIIFVPLLIVLPKLFGLNGAWACLPAIDVFGCMFSLIFFYFERKRLKREEKVISESISA